MIINKALPNILIASIAWAVAIIITRFILRTDENVFNLLSWVYFISLPYWFFVAFKEKREIKKLSKKGILVLFGIAIINTAIANIIEMYAIKYSSAINFSFLIRTVIIFTIVFAYLFLGEKITKNKIIIVIIILFGSYLLCAKGTTIKLNLGDVLTIIEAALVAFGSTILGKISVQLMNRKLSVSLSCILGALFILLTALIMGAVSWPKMPILTISLAIAITLLMHFKFKAYELATASYISMLYSLTPVYVYALSIILLKESLNLIQIIGGVLIISAGFLANKFKI